MSGSGLPAVERARSSHPALPERRPSGPSRVVTLPLYDIRVRRELAHRRFVVSVVRRVLRLATLHALDAVAVAAAVWVAASLSDLPTVTQALPALVAFVLVGLNVGRSYQSGDARRDASRLVVGSLIGVVLAALPATLPSAASPSREFIALFGLACIAALIIERRIVDAAVHQAYVRGFGLRRALIVARPHELKDLLAGLVPDQAHGRPAEDHVVIGHVTPDHSHDASALGTLSELEKILDRKDVSELVVATELRDEMLAKVANVCFERGVRLLVIPTMSQTMGVWAELTRVGNWPAYQLHPARLELPALILKRANDLVLASVGVVLALPLMLLIAICIKLESRGPVFFRQRRVGLGGREFMMWKFRSMYDEAEARQNEIAHLNPYEDARLFKLPRDPRITRVGRALRRFSLDELPQLFNILAGDMSLVGPRPPLPSEVKRYEPQHFVRLSVVPGLTGPWQVNGRNLITNFEEVVRLEREYIERWSLRYDMEIILRTLGVVLSGRGAY